MNINNDAWHIVTKELVILGRMIDSDPNTSQAFFDTATKLHTLFHVSRTFLDLGTVVRPHDVKCECEVPTA